MGNYKTVLVTGASAGFGLEIARLLAGKGYQVIACARRLEKLQALAAESGNIYPLKLDVTDERAVTALPGNLPGGIGQVDALINNAGLAIGQDRAQDSKVGDWKTMVGT
ncbi:MAG: SDR family NAD(P)-dependent oxidoreductase, partial [Succinivibrionaceae bacterium]|nr:SDR family NAD(P)-dependent oxidoreductase [Succinivibrionaceae bacterium]